MKRYPECIQSIVSDCSTCSLSSYGRDCRNAPANQLAYMRSRSGLTQQQLADRIGVTVPYLSKLETGERTINNVRLSSAVAIADALGITDVRLLMQPKQEADDDA